MSKHLQRDLENLQADLLALAASVEQAVHEAVTSLQDRDPELAQQVIDGDSKIDQEENHIEEECLKILALHQPVAVDLRRIALRQRNRRGALLAGVRKTASTMSSHPGR